MLKKNINPSLVFAIQNKGKMEDIINSFRDKHGKGASWYLKNVSFLNTGLNLLEVEEYFTALKWLALKATL